MKALVYDQYTDDDDFSKILKIKEIPIPEPKSNEVIIIERDGTKIIPDYKYFFNNKIKSEVYNLYQHDIELYNYDIQL